MFVAVVALKHTGQLGVIDAHQRKVLLVPDGRGNGSREGVYPSWRTLAALVVRVGRLSVN